MGQSKGHPTFSVYLQLTTNLTRPKSKKPPKGYVLIRLLNEDPLTYRNYRNASYHPSQRHRNREKRTIVNLPTYLPANPLSSPSIYPPHPSSQATLLLLLLPPFPALTHQTSPKQSYTNLPLRKTQTSKEKRTKKCPLQTPAASPQTHRTSRTRSLGPQPTRWQARVEDRARALRRAVTRRRLGCRAIQSMCWTIMRRRLLVRRRSEDVDDRGV